MDKHILNTVFDKIYVITLENSSRISRVMTELNGIDFEFHYGVNGETIDLNHYRNLGSKLMRGQIGCSLSHLGVYKKIVEINYKSVLILEDDIRLTYELNNLNQYIEQLPKEWGLFYLGHDGPILTNTYSQNLCEISLTNPKILHCTHAIGIQPWFAEKMLEINKNIIHTADGLLTQAVLQHSLKAYAAIPKLINPDFIDSIIGDLYNKYGWS